MKKSTLIFPVQGDSIFLGIKQQKYGAGLYNGWGGKHKSDDSLMEATAIREFREETGGATFELKDLEYVALIDFYHHGELAFECYVYFLHKWEGELKATVEMGKGEIFPCSALPFGMMMASDKLWLPLVCDPEQKEVLKAEVYYDASMTIVRDWFHRWIGPRTALR